MKAHNQCVHSKDILKNSIPIFIFYLTKGKTYSQIFLNRMKKLEL